MAVYEPAPSLGRYVVILGLSGPDPADDDWVWAPNLIVNEGMTAVLYGRTPPALVLPADVNYILPPPAQ